MPTDDGISVRVVYVGGYNPIITDIDYIKVWMKDASDLSMIVRIHNRLPRWIIKRHMSGTTLKIVSNLYEESDSALNTVSKEIFMEYLESTNKMDYEWILWNLEVLEGKYHAASEGQSLNKPSNDD